MNRRPSGSTQMGKRTFRPSICIKEDDQSLLEFQGLNQNSSKVNYKNPFSNLSVKAIRENTFGDSSFVGNTMKNSQSNRKKDLQIKVNIRRPSFTVIQKSMIPKFNESDGTSDSFFLQVFKSSPNNQLRTEAEDSIHINIRSFNSKFIRELNFKENERFRKNRRKVQINFDKQNLQRLSSTKKKNNKPYNRKQMHEIWYNGIKIVSEFKNDILHGQTEVFYPNGAKFTGKYEQGMRIFGTFDFNNGHMYWGGFLGDKFHGEGELTLPNGKVYSGDWCENQLVGKVEVKYPSGDVYYGEVKEFKKHGKGYLFFKNGDKFVGEFLNGSITGKGEYFVDEECIGRGIWKNGELVEKIENDDDFCNFDSKSSHTASNLLQNQPIPGKIRQKSLHEEEDDIQMEDIEEDAFHIEVRSNNHMISFHEIDQMNTKQSDDRREVGGNGESGEKKGDRNKRRLTQQQKNQKKQENSATQDDEQDSSKQLKPAQPSTPQLPPHNPSHNPPNPTTPSNKRSSTISFSNNNPFPLPTTSELSFSQHPQQGAQLSPDTTPPQAQNMSESNTTTNNNKNGYMDTSQRSQSEESMIRHTGRFKSIGTLLGISQKGGSGVWGNG